MSIERKLRRAQAKKEKKHAEKELGVKVALFGKLGDKCLTCEKPFDKMDREQVMSWSVVIKNETETVRLYCPECWSNAINLIEETKQGLLSKKEND